MSIPYTEIWFLELSAKYDAAHIPFDLIPESRHTRTTGFNWQWNQPAIGLTFRGIADVLWSLYGRGEIRFEWVEDSDRTSPFHPQSVHQIRALICRACCTAHRRLNRLGKSRADERRLCYTITPVGLTRWEAYARPDWSKYKSELDGRLWEAGETTWIQCATTEQYARYVLETFAMQETQPTTIHWETAHVERLVPWIPFAGKVLPEGFRISVQVTEHGQRAVPCDVDCMPSEHYRRFCEICHWYEHGVSTHPDRPKRK